jgi:uncharacterized membrane protein YfcA
MELLPLLLGLAALVYGSVGYGGASSYLAIMALAGVPLSSLKPAALCLNLIVAGIAWFHFLRQKKSLPRLTFLFLMGSIPAAVAGARLKVPTEAGASIIAFALAIGAFRLMAAARDEEESVEAPPPWIAVVSGAVIGLLAGMAGIGGGALLSPLLILARWSALREASGICAVFIFCNSGAALCAQPRSLQFLPAHFLWWATVVALGGWIGSHLDRRFFQAHAVRAALSLVLFIAAGKLVLKVFP